MSNKDDVISWANAMGDNCPPLSSILAAVGQNNARVHDAPDANGLVALLGLTNPDYLGVRFAIKEIADALPANTQQRGVAEANVSHSIIEWYAAEHMITACYAANEVDDPATGGKAWQIPKNPTSLGLNTRAMPPVVSGAGLFARGYNLATCAGCIAYLNTLPHATSGQDFPHLG